MPTLDEVIHDLNGATVFSKLDLNQGYHQLLLHPALPRTLLISVCLDTCVSVLASMLLLKSFRM